MISNQASLTSTSILNRRMLSWVIHAIGELFFEANHGHDNRTSRRKISPQVMFHNRPAVAFTRRFMGKDRKLD
jgi:hypothetical protein